MYIIYIYTYQRRSTMENRASNGKKKKKMNYCRAVQRKVERKYKESKEDM